MQKPKAKGKTAQVLRAVFGTILLIVVVMLYVGTYAMLHETLMPAWVPFMPAGIVALATGLLCAKWWRVLTGSRKRWINYCAHTAALTGVLAFAIVVSNKVFANPSPVKASVTVERIYNETHYKSKRVTRRRYTRGEPYKVYYAEIRFDNGQLRDCHIPKRVYDKLSCKRPAIIEMQEGFFGYPVFSPSTLSQPKEVKTYKRKDRGYSMPDTRMYRPR